MNRQDFSYILPEHLIAHKPLTDRSASRLMLLDRTTGIYNNCKFTDIVDILHPGDCIVINNTKVIPARLRGKIESGKEIEILLHQRIDERRWEVLCKPGRKCQKGTRIIFGDGILVAEVDEIVDDGLRNVTMFYEGDNEEDNKGDNAGNNIGNNRNNRNNIGNFEAILDQLGEVPLPPYINQESHTDQESNTDRKSNIDRYNTVYAEHEGSVAAPTAGLHFTEEILNKLKAKGVEIAQITLHVGLGTFRPVKADNITEHHMHSEYYQVDEVAAEKINRTKNGAGRVIAIGTTSCRTLESCVDVNGHITPGTGWTDIYIYPGFEFKAIDGLLTNFHLPESTLIMLVSAFCSREHVLAAYEAAIKEGYRFYSFGDAMLLLNAMPPKIQADIKNKPNEGKELTRKAGDKEYQRIPISTHIITEKDSIPDVAQTYAGPLLQKDDILFISEKAVSCSQKRALPLKEIRPRPLAKFLCKFVHKSKYGIGLAMPETMEMALRECGILRIVFAAFISALFKIFGAKGWFYRVAGDKARSIDGPTPYTLPPYNEYVVLGPRDPDKVAREVSDKIGIQVCIVDINDLGGNILGVSHNDMDKLLLVEILRDNPLGQGSQRTPMGIIRA